MKKELTIKFIKNHYGMKSPALSLPKLSAGLMFALLAAYANIASAASLHVEPGAKEFEELNPKDFAQPENIDNKWWPLQVGTYCEYLGNTVEDGKTIPHRFVIKVTDLVKNIGGVRTRVVFEADYSDDELVEQELAYFAQDKVGNVWHLGEYVEVFEEGELVGGKIWHVDNPGGAKAGIMVPVNPKVGTPSFSEGYAPPPFHWTDRGRVIKMGQKVKVPAGNYDNVLVIEEFDAERPGAVQTKYYAPGVGNVLVGWKGKEKWGTEDLKLVKITKLNKKELAEVRAKAYELEKRGSMFPQPPMQRAP